MDLEQKLAKGAFAVLAEMEPPKGVDVSAMLANARKVKSVVDAFVVPEMSNAVMRMSSLGAAMILQSKGLPAVMQVNCRDRNRIALQADLLAANGCGIRHLMAVKGEDPSFGDHHQARAVYDVDLMELLSAIQGLQQGRDMAGVELKGAPSFVVGASIAAGSPDMSNELLMDELKQKQARGAAFFVTPALFDLAAIQPFMKRAAETKAKILPTVLLLKSLGMARYIARNVDHIYIPDEVVDRIQAAPDKIKASLDVAVEMIRQLKAEGFDGVLLSTIGWEDKLWDVLKRV